jgi:transposase
MADLEGQMGDLFWLSDEAWAAIEPQLPKNQPGARRVDDRRDIRIADELIEAAGPARRLIADRGYDAKRLRCTLRSVGTVPIIPGRRSRKRPIRHDERRYRDRWRIEAAICRLKDFRRVATRYDKLALNFLSAVVPAAIIAFWV